MDIRYSCNPEDFKRYTTEQMRKEFLIPTLFEADKVHVTYSHVDRMCCFGCMPVNRSVSLDDGIDVWHNFGTDYILERREIGIFNVGGKGRIKADGVDSHFDPKFVTADLIKSVHDAGFSFHVWTIDRLATAREAFKRGADTLTTNRAKGLLAEYRKQQENETGTK